MEQEIIVLTFALIDALDRQSEANERFADQLCAVANTACPEGSNQPERQAMLSHARRHRVSAMGSRAEMAALSHNLTARLGNMQGKSAH